MKDALREVLWTATVYRSGTGSPGLSFQEERIVDIQGRTVRLSEVWTETEEDPEEVWCELTEAQKMTLEAMTRVTKDKRGTEEAWDDLLSGVVSVKRGNEDE